MKVSKYLFIFLLTTTLIACGNNENDRTDTQDRSGVISTPEKMPDMHTSQIALDWPGIYTGTLPCADCEGIETTLTLNDDNTFELHQIYLKGDVPLNFQEKGDFEWDKDGAAIHLKINSDVQSHYHYKVGENKLMALDSDGNEVMGNLREHYILEKNL